MRVRHGWIYREPGNNATPPRLRVKLRVHGEPGKDSKEVVKVFHDNSIGAQEAADYISSVIGDSWKLEDLAFLGCRIITEVESKP